MHPSDPRPTRPPAPHASECCGEGCAHCVLDIYEVALERYEAEFAAWLARHPDAGPQEDSPDS